MEKLQLIPEVLDAEPLDILKVKYQGHLIEPGVVLKPKNVKLTPELEWRDNDDALYTICMIDPDVPSKDDHRFGEFLHWLVINAPMNKVKGGITIAGYVGASPAKGTEIHRYVILVFKQRKEIVYEGSKISENSAFGRSRFSNKGFARKYNLCLVAGNVFLSEWDDYVPKIHRRLQLCPSR